MRRMHLAPKFSAPDLTTETLGIIGKRGSGKSHTGTLVVEELLDLGSQVIVIDPTGGWWGLRAGANGKKDEGFSIPIFGGQHGDMPLQDSGGAVLAEYVVENRLSCLLDLSDFSKSAMRRFVRDFCERFYQLKKRQKAPCHIVIDECDLFCPQRIDSPDMLPLVGSINDLVLRGRQAGIGVTLISQRPARIAKDVLTQVEILIAFRLTGPQDIKAFGEWIENNGSKAEQKDVLASLSSLDRGTGWFWAPGLMNGLLEKVAFRERRTFDSSATPDRQRVKPPKTLRDVDLGQLSEAMRATVEQARANDPKALKAEIARLLNETRVLKLEREKYYVEAKYNKIPAPAIDKKTLARLEKAIRGAETMVHKIKGNGGIIDTWSQRAQVIVSSLDNIRTDLKKTSTGAAAGSTPVPSPRRPEITTSSRRGTAAVRVPHQLKNSVHLAPSNGDAKQLGKGERKCMIAVAQNGADGVTKQQLTQLTGYKRSTRDAYVARLRAAGYVTEVGGRIIAMPTGAVWLGDDYEELPTGDALLQHWLGRLPEGERKVLEVLVQTPGHAQEREIIDEATGYKRSTRDAYISRLIARRLVEEAGRGCVKAADALFDHG